MAAISFDIPTPILAIGRGFFDELDLKVPATMAEYLARGKAINETKAPRVFGTTAKLESEHHSLACTVTARRRAHVMNDRTRKEEQ